MMDQLVVEIRLRDGSRLRVPYSVDFASPRRSYHITINRARLTRALRRDGFAIQDDDIADFTLLRPAQSREAPGQTRRAAGCRWALHTAHRLLPRTVRDDALYEWIDEIESASAAGRPLVRRTTSIIARTAPLLVWRAWRNPVRARGKGG